MQNIPIWSITQSNLNAKYSSVNVNINDQYQYCSQNLLTEIFLLGMDGYTIRLSKSSCIVSSQDPAPAWWHVPRQIG